MVGNDIVDLEMARQTSDWQRKGFLQKIFTRQEIATIKCADDPFLMVWRMWTMKESTYKIYIQQGEERFFNPLRLQCHILSDESGQVSIGDLHIFTCSNTGPKYIFTSATISGRALVKNHIFPISDANRIIQTKSTQEEVKRCLASRLNLHRTSLEIRKTFTGVPELFYAGEKMNIAISLTHHGHYGACSWRGAPNI